MDASVWVPLAAADHDHHERADRFWNQEAADSVAFCRVTALAFLRHLTNPRIMDYAVLSSGRAWQEFERWLSLPEVVFLEERPAAHGQLGRFAATLAIGQTSWTDAYLAAFAITGSRRLVTFDRGFRRYSGLDLLVLEP